MVCLLFSSSRSLLNVSCIFSILFPRFWIIFTLITLNSFLGRLPISSLFVWSGEFLPCSFICCIFLCLLILFNLLCLGSPFFKLQVCSSHCFWCLSPVGEVASVACVGFLVEGTSACVLVGGSGSCLSASQGRIQYCVLGVCEFRMIFGSLPSNGCGYVPVLLVVWHGVSSAGVRWPLGGAGS